MDLSDFLARLEQLYREVYGLTKRLDRIHSGRLRCGRGCNSCCVDRIAVYEIEAKNIQHHHAALLDKENPHPAGACAFLDEEGACRIYERRPYVCRTQGYPLRWLEEERDGATLEIRDICQLNETGQLIELLPDDHCWSIGPFEQRLERLQFLAHGGAMNRIALRDLFRKSLR